MSNKLNTTTTSDSGYANTSACKTKSDKSNPHGLEAAGQNKSYLRLEAWDYPTPLDLYSAVVVVTGFGCTSSIRALSSVLERLQQKAFFNA